MKVQYLGDVNDYRKYALLRLLALTGLKIGVHWLLTPDDGRNDGGKRSYLAQLNPWRSYDPELFDVLATVPPVPTFDDFRQIEQRDIIPHAVYWDELVPTGTVARQAYHAASMEAFVDRDLVFFDPDNGLAVASVTKGRAAGIKFVFDDELAEHYAAERSLLIYQHFPRLERAQFLRDLGVRLRAFAPDAEMWACHTAHVVFLLVVHPNLSVDQAGAISAAIEDGRRRWSDNFIKFDLLPPA